jgi:hypothetical protein
VAALLSRAIRKQDRSTLDICPEADLEWNFFGGCDVQSCSQQKPRRAVVAENSAGVGVMGVLVGALIVIVVGGGILYATGTIGSNSSTVKIELPKIK